ncbi:MAG: glycosyltransferase family 4 protein, partial [bacterium]
TNKLFPVECGGAEKYIWDFAKILSEIGYEVHLLTPSTDKNIPNVENVYFHFIPAKLTHWGKRFSYLSKGFSTYKNLIKDYSFDLIIDNASPIPFYPIYSIKSNVEIVTIVHAIFDTNVFKFKDGFLTKIATYFAEKTLKFLNNKEYITVSNSTKEELSKLIKNKKIKIVENSFNPDVFNYEFNDDGDFLLCLTRLSNRKGVKYLLYAWKELDIDYKLKIAGKGPQMEKLKKIKNNLDLNDVEFLGYVSKKDKLNLLNNAKLYILPTLGEGFGISNLEAMAAGTPVISTNTWGVKDYINDGENGFLAEPENANSLAGKIETALSDEDLRKEISIKGRKTAEQYSLENTKNQVTNYIDEFFGDQK